MPLLETDDQPIAYGDDGAGSPALLLMPGWCAPRSVFETLIPRLAESRRVLSIDWRGHGASGPALADFGTAQMAEDARRVADAAGVDEMVPVALAHTGWVAIELRRRLGARVPSMVLLEWIVAAPPPPFVRACRDMRSPEKTRAAVDALSRSWAEGIDDPPLHRHIQTMRSCPPDMWARAGREILGAYARSGSPLQALATLRSPPRVLHLQTPSHDLPVQRGFAMRHPWYQVRTLNARSRFPMFEVPGAISQAIVDFTAAGAYAGRAAS
jgi:pimeloyl-ACP methyl ester carboxylesterase